MGGWAALAACLVIGPRLGVFERNAKDFAGSHLPLAMLGVLLLWFGWIGFNGGSTLSFNDQVPGIIANTMLAASAGLVVAMGVSLAVDGYVRVPATTNGPLAGLVAITACCHCVSAWQAVVIGAVGAVAAMGTERALVRLKIDDVIGAVPVHLVAGVWGTLAVALFGDLAVLDTGLTRFEQLGIQAKGIGMCGAVGFGIGLPVFWAMHRYFGLRVDEQAERDGLNHAEHRAKNDLFEFINGLEKQTKSRDLSARVAVEPFTEVGMIASRFNVLMDVIEQSTTDIEHLKKTREKLADAKAAAEEANFAKGEFLANMSHEIRTPLHGILSYAGFGLKRAETVPIEKLREYFEKIDLSGQRLLHLVNDLLDLSKLEAGQMVFEFENRSVATVVAGVVDEMASLLSECRIRVDLHQSATDLKAEIDTPRLMQVVRNVLNNAVKFSPANASIDVWLKAVDDAFELRIQDHGPGIPDDELGAVFDKFIQSSKTKSGAGGTGLGLSICRQIVDGHHGKIWAENGPDHGAVFFVRIPLVQPADPDQPKTIQTLAA